MNLAEIAIKKRAVMVVLTLVLAILGIVCYLQLGRLEYPAFTIKEALVVTAYPGATPKEVEEEVTDVLEEAIQSMGQLESVKSTCREGLSVINVKIKAMYHSHEIPQVWDELRRKISDVTHMLPEGVKTPEVVDDFGDVYGVFFAITGDGYSLEDLRKHAVMLKKELLLVDGVAKIDIWGEQPEVIYVEFDRSGLASLGISMQQIFSTLNSQNMVEESGKVQMGDEYIRFKTSGNLSTEAAIENLYIRGRNDNLIQLKDIALVYRGYEEPAKNLLQFNGQPAIGIGVSTEAGGNVVEMGQAVKKRLKALEAVQPLGIEQHVINFQADNVTESLNDFLINLIEAVVIVIVLLLFFMGLRSGLLIGGVLLLTILATFIGMKIMAIDLQLISLGALVLALGMLVDNAIVVVDGVLIKLEAGRTHEQAAIETVAETQWPLFGATIVAILAFTAIGFNPGSAGEFCRSLFYVMAISLFLSWILAITITPLLCIWFLKAPVQSEPMQYTGRIYQCYKQLLSRSLRYRKTTYAVLMLITMLGFYAFSFVPERFFSESTRNQFLVDFWRSESTHIANSSTDIAKIAAFIQKQPGVESVASFIGEGTLRFVLTYNYNSPNSSYSQILVTVDDYHKIDGLIPQIESHIARNYPDAESKVTKFSEGPPVEYTVEARFRGPDKETLRQLAQQAKTILRNSKQARDIRDNWRQPVKRFDIQYSEAQARRTGVTRSDLNQSLQWAFSGLRVGTYREGDELLPIISRPPQSQRQDVENLDKVQVWSSAFYMFLPLHQVVEDIKLKWHLPMIKRRNRESTITVQCNQISGMASTLLAHVRPAIEAIPLAPGYSLEWGGEYEESAKGQAGLKKLFPICLLSMFIVIAFLFRTLREPLIIFLCLPFAITGVAFGLLVFKLAFGFMAILGFLGLSGMLIKNAIVLLDQINLEKDAGKLPQQAVVDASVSRLRPVTMAAGTTILGMIPLVIHPFFSAMAATIMCGLLAATALTLIIVPVMYVSFFRVTPTD